MNMGLIKSAFFLIIMIVFIIMAFVTSDPINTQLYTALGIISSAFANKFISNVNPTKNE